MTTSTSVMQFTKKWMGSLVLAGLVAASAVVLLVLLLVNPSSETVEGTTANGPAKVEAIEGTEVNRLTLTAKAAERLDIQVAEVADSAVPYGALLYDLDGGTFV